MPLPNQQPDDELAKTYARVRALKEWENKNTCKNLREERWLSGKEAEIYGAHARLLRARGATSGADQYGAMEKSAAEYVQQLNHLIDHPGDAAPR